MGNCTPFDPAGPFVQGAVSYADCHALALAEGGYQALASGSGPHAAIHGLMVIAIAIFGYRMVLGETPALRDVVALAVRIGIVLALAMRWSAYQPVVFDLVVGGPSSVVGVLSETTGQASLIDRVQSIDSRLALVVHPENEPPGGQSNVGVGQAASVANGAAINPTAGSRFELAPDAREYLTSADHLIVGSFLASTITVRVASALLLALGPLFMAALLFEAATGWLVGWLRALAATVLAAVALPVVAGLGLGLVEPLVQKIVLAVDAGQALRGLPEQLWLVGLLFSVVVALVSASVALAAFAIRIPARARLMVRTVPRDAPVPPPAVPARAASQRQSVPQPGHAQRVAEAAHAIVRREAQAGGVGDVHRAAGRRIEESGSTRTDLPQVGQFGRQAMARQSAAAARRDGNDGAS